MVKIKIIDGSSDTLLINKKVTKRLRKSRRHARR